MQILKESKMQKYFYQPKASYQVATKTEAPRKEHEKNIFLRSFIDEKNITYAEECLIQDKKKGGGFGRRCIASQDLGETVYHLDPLRSVEAGEAGHSEPNPGEDKHENENSMIALARYILALM